MHCGVKLRLIWYDNERTTPLTGRRFSEFFNLRVDDLGELLLYPMMIINDHGRLGLKKETQAQMCWLGGSGRVNLALRVAIAVFRISFNASLPVCIRRIW